MAVVVRRRPMQSPAVPTAPQFFALTPDKKFAAFRAVFPKEAHAMLLMMDLVWEAAAAKRRHDLRRK